MPQPTSKINHPAIGEVTLRYSARATRVAISVQPSGEVRLTIPARCICDQSEALRFLDSRIDWIIATREKMAQRVVAEPKVEEMSREEWTLLCAKANEYLPIRIAEIAKECRFKYSGVRITATRSKWGSCRSDNRISLSVFLMRLPKHLIDFVIVHELCHTVYHNHSKEFHALVDFVLGGRERELIAELKGYRA